ncbi:MAG TPA: hypothetical protein VEI02_06140, partial [Planctomycetota bacterium]|nr:hypothetical protein [Planctomycetota bacterium]
GESGAPSGAVVRRVGDRTLYLRDGLFVDARALDLDEQALSTRVVRLTAFGDAYFALLAERPALAPMLALGDVLFVDGDRIYLVLASADAAASRPVK